MTASIHVWRDEFSVPSELTSWIAGWVFYGIFSVCIKERTKHTHKLKYSRRTPIQ